ncbi:hypothetical protein L7F22_007230 [Adiantum nelumboides]|nr:hypothetical protein [Adiantum nelumboides]
MTRLEDAIADFEKVLHLDAQNKDAKAEISALNKELVDEDRRRKERRQPPLDLDTEARKKESKGDQGSGDAVDLERGQEGAGRRQESDIYAVHSGTGYAQLQCLTSERTAEETEVGEVERLALERCGRGWRDEGASPELRETSECEGLASTKKGRAGERRRGRGQSASFDARLVVDRIDELGPEGQEWTPLAKDVLTNLARFPGCILLTRVGGFYESYFEQAPVLANLTGIKLAKRTFGGRTVPMAGFPIIQLEKYLKVLVQDHGKLVAICDEFKAITTPANKRISKKEEDGDVRLNEAPQVTITRRVSRVVSRGTLIDEKFLDPFSSNWVLSVTADAAGSMPEDLNVLAFHQQEGEEGGHPPLLHRHLGRRRETETMHIDAHTLLALEVRASATGSTSGSLLSTVRRTITKGGSRLLSEWLTAPSTLLPVIHRRQSLVDLFVKQGYLRQDLRTWLRKGVGDVSRALQRITTGRNDEQDLLEVRDFVATCKALVELLGEEIQRQGGKGGEEGWKTLQTLVDRFQPLDELGARLGEAIDEGVIEKRSRDQEELARQRHDEVLEDVTAAAVRRDEGLGEARASASKIKNGNKQRADKDDQSEERNGIWGTAFEHMIRPNASKELTSLTKEHIALRRRAARFEQELRRRMGTEKLTLRNVQKQGFVVHVQEGGASKSKGDDEELDKMYLSAHGKTFRTYLHPEWTNWAARWSM